MLFIIVTNVYLVFMYYSETYESLREKKYDLQNINLSDYSVEMVITQKMKDEYKKHRANNPKSDQTLIQLIKEKIDSEIKKCDKVLKDDLDGSTDVVDVSVAYDNSEMLKLLQKRGTVLGAGQFSKYDEVEKEINDMLENDHAKITTPVKAFIIFND